MDFSNLHKLVSEKLASQPTDEVLHQCFEGQIGELALNTIKNADIKDDILGALGKAKDTISGVAGQVGDAATKYLGPQGAQAAGAGLLGAGAGALIGNQTSSKGDLEDEDTYKHRKLNSTLTGALAGGVLGAATPSLIDAAKASAGLGGPEPGALDKARDAVFSPAGAFTAAGAGAGIVGLGAHDFLQSNQIRNLGQGLSGLGPMDKGRATLVDLIGKATDSLHHNPVYGPNAVVGAMRGSNPILKALLHRYALVGYAGAGAGALTYGALSRPMNQPL